MKHSLFILALLVLGVVTFGRLELRVQRVDALAPSLDAPSATIPSPASEDQSSLSQPAQQVHLESAPKRLNEILSFPDDVDRLLTSRGIVVMDGFSGRVLAGRGIDEPVPIASVTKLLSAMVLIDHFQDWDQMVTIQSSDLREGEPVVMPGERMSASNLFSASLIRSSNTGIMALGRAAGLTTQELVDAMNQKAVVLGLSSTHITDPTGLLATTVASPHDVAVLVHVALQQTAIRSALSRSSFQWPLLDAKGDVLKSRSVVNTNQLIQPVSGHRSYSVVGGKTGYLPEAGYNLALESETNDQRRYVVVVLGARTFDARFSEANRLLEWILTAFPIVTEQS